MNRETPFLCVSRLRAMPKAEDRAAKGFLIAGSVSATVALVGWVVALFSYMANDSWTRLGAWAALIAFLCTAFTVVFLLFSWLYRKRLIDPYDSSGGWVIGG